MKIKEGDLDGFENFDRPLDQLSPDVTDDLMKFNLSIQRIVDLANAEFEEDWIHEPVAYSSWHRALKGKEVYEALVIELEQLRDEQLANPRKFLPRDKPDNPEELRTWMKQIAKAPWWHATLGLEVKASSFNAWMSGRPMGQEKVTEVVRAVDAWWSKLQAVVDQAEIYTWYRQMEAADQSARQTRKYEIDDSPADREFEPLVSQVDTYFYRLLQKGTSPEEAQRLYSLWESWAYDFYPRTIDLSDPKVSDTRVSTPTEAMLKRRDSYIARLIASDFEHADKTSITPPDGIWEKSEQVVKTWPGRRSEMAPRDLNEPLWGKKYRRTYDYKWNSDTRKYDVVNEQLHVFENDEWRDANKRELQGWDEGIELTAQEYARRGFWPDNAWTTEYNACETRKRNLEHERTNRFSKLHPKAIETQLAIVLGELEALRGQS